MKTTGVLRKAPLALAVALIATCAAAEEAPEGAVADPDQPIEEVVVIGRFLSSAEALVEERKNDAAVTDIMGAELISRMGDSTVAAALRRISGLTLVRDKFVYVRGLGERYSSSTLNGMYIPSPDLTRNVIPLDIFPTSVVESLRVQKSYSADMSANFGGGAVDIRTIGVPDDFTYTLEFGVGYNTASDDDRLGYSGGDDDFWGTDDGTRDLSSNIVNAITNYQGDIDAQSIFAKEAQRGNAIPFPQAQEINREIALNLFRELNISDDKSNNPDYDVKGTIGSNFLVGENWEFGFIGGGSFDKEYRTTQALARNFSFPDERIDNEIESTESTTATVIGDFGVRYTDDHEVKSTLLWLRNTDDETAISDFFNENREVSDGRGFRNYRLEWEERNMSVVQFQGTHRTGGATKELLRGWVDWLPDEFEVSWYYSDSDAETDLPSRVAIDAETTTDPITAEVLSSRIAPSNTAGDWRDTELDDDVKDWGW